MVSFLQICLMLAGISAANCWSVSSGSTKPTVNADLLSRPSALAMPKVASFQTSSSSARSISGAATIDGNNNFYAPLFNGPSRQRQSMQNFVEKVWSRGTKTHALYAVAMLFVPVLFSACKSSSCSPLSQACMTFSFFGMFYDNAVNAIGKALGEGKTLRVLTKGRYLFHGMVMPLLMVPVMEMAKFHNLINGKACAASIAMLIAAALVEGMDWLHYDDEQFVVADNRDVMEHPKYNLAGTLKYNCPNIAKCVVPAVVTTLAQIASGVLLTIKASSALGPMSGLWVLSAGLTALSSASCFSKRPDLQLFIEPASLAMIWAAASTL